MELLDPATGARLPANAIQRVLLVAPKVHVYNIPPLTSTKGYVAASWTDDPKRHIFTCRMRLVETAVPSPSDEGGEKVKVDVVLEDPSSATLFAAAPYTTPAAVEPALDSSRFFALRVQDPSGRKATLGIGFEDRSDAFEFSVALQEARKSLGIVDPAERQRETEKSKKQKEEKEDKRDYSLKEGETITINFGGSRFGRRTVQHTQTQKEDEGDKGATGSLNSFALPPPPAPGASSVALGGIAPPPVASGRHKNAAQDLGFDDGQFGEFA